MNRGVLLALLLGGCDSNTHNASVNGVVTLDGELAKFGVVAFHPVKSGSISYAQIASDGTYVLRTGLGDPARPELGSLPAGEYVATVVISLPPQGDDTAGDGGSGPPKPGVRLSPDRYASAETSPLRFTVQPGPNSFNLSLHREGVVELAEQASAAETSTGEKADEEAATAAPSETTDITPTDAASTEPAAEPVVLDGEPAPRNDETEKP